MVLGVVVVGGALAVGAAQWHHIAALEDSRVDTTAALGALHLGKLRPAQPSGSGSAARFDDQGRRAVSVWLTVRNGGPEPVTVDVEGVSGTYARLIDAQSGSTVDAGASAVVTVDLAVDCSAVPAVTGGSASPQTALDEGGAPSPESWFALRVTPAGSDPSASQAWRYDTLPVPAYSLPGVLTRSCATR